MANNPPPSNFLSNSFVVALLAVTGAIYVSRQAPLEGARPLQTDPQLHRSFAPETIELRLWQDPIAGIAESAQAKGDGKSGNESRCATVPAPLPANDATSVIGVMLPGAPYFETGERRRRTRYAVASALAEEGFAKEFGDRIGCWRTIDDIPFETFANRAAEKIVVLWLNEDTLGREQAGPERALATTRRERGLLQGLARVAQDLGTTRLKIIGPYSSDSLVTMIRDSAAERRPASRDDREAMATFGAPPISDAARPEWTPLIRALQAGPVAPQTPWRYAGLQRVTDPPGAADRDPNDLGDLQSLDGVSFYAYGATIAPAALHDAVKELRDRDQKPFESAETFLEKQVRLNLYRSIADDSLLAKAIFEELDRRSVEAGENGRHVALISEWDTIYGRTLPGTIAVEFDKSCATDCDWIHRRTYERGLDGDLSTASASKPSSTKPDKGGGKDDAKQRKAEAFDRPYGQGQQDYLRRLARSLKRQEGGAGPTSHLAAIGVLGSDVFDKLLVLRALKPEFPDTLFFTTDLDLTLTVPSERDWTRNLVVASSFGPELHPNMQGNIPPFRDSYETSAFFATRLAVRELNSKCRIEPSAIRERLKASLAPRLFELDRHGELVAFKDRAATPLSLGCPSDSFDRAAIHPPYTPETPKGLPWIALALLAPATIAFAVWTLNWSHRGKGRPAQATTPAVLSVTREFNASLLLLALAGLLFLAPLYYSSRLPTWASGMGAILWLILALLALVVLEIRRNPGIFDFTSPLRTQSGARAETWPATEFTLIVFIFTAAVLACLLWPRLANVLSQYGAGEPLILLGGVSLWPVIMLRFLTLILTIGLLLRGLRMLSANLVAIADEMQLANPGDIIAAESKRRARVFHRLRKESLYQAICFEVDAFLSMFSTRSAFSSDEKEYDIDRKWRDLVLQGRWRARCARVATYTITMIVAFTGLAQFAGWPHTPARDAGVKWLYGSVTLSDVCLMLVLIFFVADATRSFWLFVRELGAHQTKWPEATRQKYAELTHMHADDRLLDYWIDLVFIEKRTLCIGQLLYYPFIVIAFMIVSRSPIFANFSANAAIVITISLGVSILLICAFALRRAAEETRADARRKIAKAVDAAATASKPPANTWKQTSMRRPARLAERKPTPEQLKALLEDVNALSDGAFLPISQQPPVRAIFLPLASTGLTLLTSLHLIPGT